jgi:hypothetical protein
VIRVPMLFPCVETLDVQRSSLNFRLDSRRGQRIMFMFREAVTYMLKSFCKNHELTNLLWHRTRVLVDYRKKLPDPMLWIEKHLFIYTALMTVRTTNITSRLKSPCGLGDGVRTTNITSRLKSPWIGRLRSPRLLARSD